MEDCFGCNKLKENYGSQTSGKKLEKKFLVKLNPKYAEYYNPFGELTGAFIVKRKDVGDDYIYTFGNTWFAKWELELIHEIKE